MLYFSRADCFLLFLWLSDYASCSPSSTKAASEMKPTLLAAGFYEVGLTAPVFYSAVVSLRMLYVCLFKELARCMSPVCYIILLAF